MTAARKLPLDRRTPARERTEAAGWRDFMVGEDETYVSAVDSWRKDVVAAAVLARDVTRDDATDTRSQIARMLAGWSKEHGPGGYIRSHLASAVKRSRRTLIADTRRIDKALAAAQAALDDLMPHPGKDDFPPLYAAPGRAGARAQRRLPGPADRARRLHRGQRRLRRVPTMAAVASPAPPLVSCHLVTDTGDSVGRDG